MMNIKPKVAIVAGVGPGLGAALCCQLVAEGYTVYAFSRSGGKSPKENKTGEIIEQKCDITDHDAFKGALKNIIRQSSVPCVYIHNAHFLSINSFLDLAMEDFERAWKTAVGAAVTGIQTVLPNMLNRQAGTIIMTGATASIRGGANFSAFASAKFALRGLSQSLAREYGPQGIHITHVLFDGIIWGAQSERFKMEKSQCLQPDEIARQYIMVINQPKSVWTQELDLRPSTEKF